MAVLRHETAQKIAVEYEGHEIGGWRAISVVGIPRQPPRPLSLSFIDYGWVLDSSESCAEEDVRVRARAIDDARQDIDGRATEVWAGIRRATRVVDDRALGQRLAGGRMSVFPSAPTRLVGIGDMETWVEVDVVGDRLRVSRVSRGHRAEEQFVDTAADAGRAAATMAGFA